MGWAIGFDSNWQRDIGYGVPAICDHPECWTRIDRWLDYVCGGEPYGEPHGCGLYFCHGHLRMAGDRRDNKQLCWRCHGGRWGSYKAKPDVQEWIDHKATDESWAEWRKRQSAGA